MNQPNSPVKPAQWMRPVIRWATRFSLAAPKWLPDFVRFAPCVVRRLCCAWFTRVCADPKRALIDALNQQCGKRCQRGGLGPQHALAQRDGLKSMSERLLLLVGAQATFRSRQKGHAFGVRGTV